jgi:hypothetical protein
MRRILLIVAMTFASMQASAGTEVRDAEARAGNRGAMQWAKRAPMSAVTMRDAVVEAQAAEANGARPIALLETNYYTFLAGEPLEVRLTVHPNGFGAPVTMYLYKENRVTGERRYHNAMSGLLPAGEQADVFGSVGSPAPVFVPSLSDFVLFGSAGSSSALSWGKAGALGAALTVPSNEPGLHQWVVELRDAAGKRVISRSNAMYSHVTETVTVSGTITSSTTWTSDKRYILNDFVGVAAPATLTIEPGTVIYGGGTRATLFIQRGAKIVADGTARRPVIFTSAQRVGDRAQRDWGSLVVLGNAPLNVAGGQAFLEGLPSQPAYSYGGNDPADSSGVIRYVRLEFGGFEIQTGQEINGLTLAGVGRGTVVDHVEVLQNKDDAFEFFGGTVNAKHLLAIGWADDALDFDQGYLGSVQFAAFVKRAENDESDSNIFTESDNNATGGPDTPLTSASVYNVTSVRVASGTGNYGGVIRRNSAGRFFNSIITGSRLAPITVRDSSTHNNVASGALVFDNSLLHGDFSDAAFPSSSDRAEQTRTFLFSTMKNNRNTNPMLAIGTPTLVSTYMPDLAPLGASPALDAGFVANPPDNGFLEAVDYIGAIGPGENWMLTGWANFSDN